MLSQSRARLATVLGGLAAIGLLLLLFSTPARAAHNHSVESTFQLQTPGQVASVAVDEETGYVYAVRRFFSPSTPPGEGDIERFDAAGNPVPFPSSPGRNETQTVTFSSFASNDKFTLTCPNGETTGEMAWNNNGEILRENMQAAMEAKCGAGNFSFGFGAFNMSVQFTGAFAATNVPTMTCTKVTGSGSCTITNIGDGAAPGTLNVIETPCNSSCFEIAVDNTGGPNQGVIYLSSTNNVGNDVNGYNPEGGIHVFLPSGQYVGQIRTRSQDHFSTSSGAYVRHCGVAVEPNGDIVVAHGEGGTRFSYFDKLDISNWETSPNLDPPILGTIKSDFGGPCRTEIDSEGNVYSTVGNETFASGPLRKYPANAFEVHPQPEDEGGPWETPSAVPSQLLASGSNVDLALDGDGNVITVNTAGEFLKWSTENGSPIEQFDIPTLFEPGGVATNNSTGKVYITDRGFNEAAKDVTILKSTTVPDSVTGNFAPVTATTGTVDGEVDPAGGGEITGCEFEVVNNAKFIASKFAEATKVPCEPGAPLSSPEEVSAEVSGLSLEELHRFRLRTENANGVSLGSIHQFVPHAVIDIATKPATNVAPRSATLNASYEGNGEATEYYFEYGTNQSYGSTTPVQSAGEPTGPEDVSQALGSLELETTYHYRVVMTNAVGTSKGEDQSFTTHPAVAGLATKPATSLDQESLTLNGEFQGEGLDTKYFFQYLTQEEYEEQGERYEINEGGEISEGPFTKKTPLTDAGVTNGPTSASAEIDQFNGFKTYHYRVVAENSFGVSYGQDETLVAPEPLVPDIENTEVLTVTPTTATVSTEINPNHWATIYLFEWGETVGYGTATPFSEPIGGLKNEPIEVTEELTGLTPGSIYHFRSVAVNFRGTTEGEDLFFITPDVPRVDETFSKSVTKTSAHLGGLVAARASSTNVSFQYGTSTAYGASTAQAPIGEELTSREVGADLSNLAPGTTYHFRIAATNAFGTTYGPDETFTTVAEPTTQKPTADCERLSRKARKFANQARRLRGKAKGAKGKHAHALRRRARRSSKKAARLNDEAQACKSTSGGSGQ
ncbi:MAG TPA: hypothetical protein VGF04_06600 [Solirubrobacterales bacterium]|jgi:hypothetical protein